MRGRGRARHAVVIRHAQRHRVVGGRRVRVLWVLGRRGRAVTEVPAPTRDRAVTVRARIREVHRQIRHAPRVARSRRLV